MRIKLLYANRVKNIRIKISFHYYHFLFFGAIRYEIRYVLQKIQQKSK